MIHDYDRNFEPQSQTEAPQTAKSVERCQVWLVSPWLSEKLLNPSKEDENVDT